MSLTSVILFLDKIVDKEVSNLKTLSTWISEFQAVAATIPGGLLESQIEAGLSALLPLVNLVSADLSAVATTLDKTVAAAPVTPTLAAQAIVSIGVAVSAAAPDVKQAAAAIPAAVEAEKSGGH